MSSVDIGRYVGTLWKWLWLLLLSAAIAGFVSYYFNSKVPNLYVSTTTLMVGDPIRNPSPSPDQMSVSQHLADTYRQMLVRQPFLEAAVSNLQLNMTWQELRTRILIVPIPGAPAFEIRAMDPNPFRAREIAAGIAQQLIDSSPTAANQREQDSRRQFIRGELDALQAKIVTGKDDLDKKRAALGKETGARSVLDLQDQIKGIEINLNEWRAAYRSLLASYEDSGSPNVITMIEPATVPPEPANPNSRIWNVLLAVLAALGLAVVGILVIEYLDDTVKTKDDIEALMGTPALGIISEVPSFRKDQRVILPMQAEDSPGAEAYRAMAANLRFAAPSSTVRRLLVTSATPGEGKSTTAANLAAALALTGKQVLLVDLDLRNPSLHSWFGVSNERGVSAMLLNPNLPLSECVISTPLPQLKLVTSGEIPPNPSELIASSVERLFQRLQGQADYIIVDSAPLLAGSDAILLAGTLDGVLLIAKSGQTQRGVCSAAREILARAHGRLLGTVLNAVPRANIGFYSYSYRSRDRGRQGWWRWFNRGGQSRGSAAAA